ncbi:MAG: hypothetical protein ACR2J8_04375 [Thermomicrobiales bacterium]
MNRPATLAVSGLALIASVLGPVALWEHWNGQTTIAQEEKKLEGRRVAQRQDSTAPHAAGVRNLLVVPVSDSMGGVASIQVVNAVPAPSGAPAAELLLTVENTGSHPFPVIPTQIALLDESGTVFRGDSITAGAEAAPAPVQPGERRTAAVHIPLAPGARIRQALYLPSPDLLFLLAEFGNEGAADDPR